MFMQLVQGHTYMLGQGLGHARFASGYHSHGSYPFIDLSLWALKFVLSGFSVCKPWTCVVHATITVLALSFVALLSREIVFLDAIILIHHSILCCKYLFHVETQTLNDTSSGGSMASFFKRGHDTRYEWRVF